MTIDFFKQKFNGTYSMTSSRPSIYVQTLAALLTVLAILLVSACGKSEQAKPVTEKNQASAVAHVQEEPKAISEQGVKLSAEEIEAAGIKVAPLEEQAVNDQITVTATIQANQDKLAHVAPRVQGKVTKVMANLGDKVKQGQPLALIDSIEVGEAQSAYAQAFAEHGLAKAAADRAEKLYAEQIIAQKDYLRSRADVEKSKAVLRAASDKRQMLGIDGRSESAGISVFAVSAPFSGIVIEKKAVSGELAQSDKALFSVADLSTVWIETNLYEKDLDKIKVGAQALVTTAAYPNDSFKGKVTYISSIMDKESHTAKARVEVANADGRLKLEMFATAAIATAEVSKALLLPAEAVVLIQGQPTAFVQEANGFVSRAVDLGENLHGQVMLKAGIKPGEKVVVKGAYALKAKMLKSQISAE